EIAVRLERVARDADDAGPRLLEVGMQVAKALRLGGAARRVIFGIKIQHGPVPGEGRVGDLAFGAGCGEVGQGAADGDLTHSVGSRGSKAATTRRPSAIKML